MTEFTTELFGNPSWGEFLQTPAEWARQIGEDPEEFARKREEYFPGHTAVTHGVTIDMEVRALSTEQMHIAQALQPANVNLHITFMGESMAIIPGSKSLEVQQSAAA